MVYECGIRAQVRHTLLKNYSDTCDWSESRKTIINTLLGLMDTKEKSEWIVGYLVDEIIKER